MPGAFELSENEREIKTYHCTQLKFPPCAGYLTVTNMRLVFHGFSSGLGGGFLEGLFTKAPGNDTGINSRIVNEVKLESVSGMNTFYGAKVHAWKAILGCVFLVISLWLLFTANGTNAWTGRRSISAFNIIAGLAFLALSVWQLLRCFRRSFFIRVYSSQATGAITIGEGVSGVLGSAAVFSMSALPTYETDQMMRELGAMVLDIQKLGDKAIKKWAPEVYKEEERRKNALENAAAKNNILDEENGENGSGEEGETLE